MKRKVGESEEATRERDSGGKEGRKELGEGGRNRWRRVNVVWE